MAIREGVRPGGRSARVQESVHGAVRALLAERERSELTVPLIAARAGVTPSTIYRRWGELPDLLADVAVERLRPDADPRDTGSLRGDLHAWAAQLLDEMASQPGQAMVRDVLGSTVQARGPAQCASFTLDHIGCLLERARLRGEPAPAPDAVVDRIVAPIMYRTLYGLGAPGADYSLELVDACLREASGRGGDADQPSPSASARACAVAKSRSPE